MEERYYEDLADCTWLTVEEIKELFETYEKYFGVEVIEQVIKKQGYNAGMTLYGMVCDIYGSY